MKRLLLATTLAIAVAPQVVHAQAESTQVRRQTALTDNWRFRQDDAVAGAEAPSFNDQDWQRVSVPHTWNRVGVYLPGPIARTQQTTDVNKAQGVGWYRLSFAAPKLDGKRAYLQFDAASRAAKVWLNGIYLGEHQGGFSRFRLDATDALRAGDNLLVVRTDNSKPAPGSATVDNLPLTGDFFVHGGLYRPASLVLTNAIHFDMLDFGGSGVYARTASLSTDKADIAIRARLRNDLSKARPVRVEARLYDAEGKLAAKAGTEVALAAQTAQDASLSLALTNPHPWNGVADPYLYRLETDVIGKDGKLLDRVSTAFGVRRMAFDADKGFLLNGKPYRLKGVGYHQDREGKGWAVAPADVEEDMAILREMGANSIRLTHYQHGQTIHDLADKYGIILWDEIPLVSAWTTGGALEPTPALVENAKQQLRELIRQNYNHASVATWGIANEVDFGNSFPAFLTGYKDGKAPDPMPLLNTLNQLAHQEDPGRPTALATCCEGRVFAAGVDVPTTAEAADLGGANRYFGWYFGETGDLGPHLDALRAKRPRQPLSVTEYGAGGGVTIHTDDVLGGPIDSRGRIQPEEFESHVHETAWAALSQRPWLWGTWIWNSFDFATTIRHEGDADDINTKGLVTYDRKIRKDAWYFYKANWSDSPTVHINGRRYVDRAYPVTEVRVYSNGATTDLTLNGESLGQRANCPQHVCVWPAVRLAPGENVLVARGSFGGRVAEDRIVWRRPTDPTFPVRIDAGSIVGAGKTVAFGSDAFFQGGQAQSANTPADYGRPLVRAAISGTDEVDVAASYRQGRFSYAVPIAPGRYRVRLTFVEPSLASGERRFDVRANGAPVLQSLDVAAQAGGPLKALDKTFEVNAGVEGLTLQFIPTLGEAIVSAIEIRPVSTVISDSTADRGR
ncbi:glycoside hydrolase family 2 TIM barrel-domain containing protein [Caulobacter sp. RL271]|uniref:Malectin domain-containing carbohydrate-binding protein n=1 Tax=Caulobacter segnis TaxID=88688 RepID=A0ABY4ZRY8_9CAUL|nr:glycoside hydrolase family 2 TIM barrel-domain containing protein [Caulobacter segnis]USQ95430.1 malectin domain-containing carbohydrate-binding protein [Caulobacter segnis]